MFLSMGWSTIQMRHLIKNSQILKSGLYEALSVHDQGNAWHESYYHRKAHPRAALPNTSEDTNDQQAAREPRCYNLVDCRHQTALQGSVSSTCGIEFQPSFIPQQKQVKTFRKETCKALHAEKKVFAISQTSVARQVKRKADCSSGRQEENGLNMVNATDQKFQKRQRGGNISTSTKR